MEYGLFSLEINFVWLNIVGFYPFTSPFGEKINAVLQKRISWLHVVADALFLHALSHFVCCLPLRLTISSDGSSRREGARIWEIPPFLGSNRSSWGEKAARCNTSRLRRSDGDWCSPINRVFLCTPWLWQKKKLPRKQTVQTFSKLPFKQDIYFWALWWTTEIESMTFLSLDLS